MYAGREGSDETANLSSLTRAFTACICVKVSKEKHSDSVVECLTQDGGVADSSLNRGTVLCPYARHFILCLVHVSVHPKKTHPDMTE